MNRNKIILCLIFCGIFSILRINAQLEDVIVEKYYVSDAIDATDLDGGVLDEGSVTYRIFVDLAEGASLMSVYGYPNHPLVFTCTHKFFNNSYSGKSYGYKISQNALKRNTMALDSWITIGFASNKHFGILKTEDTDSSVVGGKYNDGGSEGIAGGLLVNNSPLAGNVTQKDGLVQTLASVADFYANGFEDPISGEDTTIFGNVDNKGELVSTDAIIGNRIGIHGSTPGNKILIAQLTTKGLIGFKLNLEIRNSEGRTIYFVAEEPLGENTVYSSLLSYPPKCGCTDPDFLEFSETAACDDGSCKTPIVFGCTDPASCNFNPQANRNIPELCCYNSKCALDLGIVCPGTTYGCMDENSFNYNPEATKTSEADTCCYVAGCRDNRFLEYNPEACYGDTIDYCKVIRISGCMDREACNYNPVANFADNTVCKYGCMGKSFSAPDESESNSRIYSNGEFQIFPNPVENSLSLRIFTEDYTEVGIEICDIFGRILIKDSFISCTAEYRDMIDLSGTPQGIYIFKLTTNGRLTTKTFVKN
jgi:hypothetical protein